LASSSPPPKSPSKSSSSTTSSALPQTRPVAQAAGSYSRGSRHSGVARISVLALQELLFTFADFGPEQCSHCNSAPPKCRHSGRSPESLYLVWIALYTFGNSARMPPPAWVPAHPASLSSTLHKIVILSEGASAPQPKDPRAAIRDSMSDGSPPPPPEGSTPHPFVIPKWNLRLQFAASFFCHSRRESASSLFVITDVPRVPHPSRPLRRVGRKPLHRPAVASETGPGFSPDNLLLGKPRLQPWQ
jgi:hypothetical protein